MVSKLKALEKSDENALVEAMCSSAHQIWQAGLGAFARAQEEGGDVFAKLVQQGVELQKRTQQLAGDKGFGVADTVTRLAENVGRQAGGSWEKLEKVFEERVSRSLRNLGVTTQEDIKGLSRQIDELNKSINALAKKSATAEKPVEKSAEKAVPKRRAVKAVGKVPAKAEMKAPATKARKPARPAAGQA
jgi:poly(hydroxyalkanoate) granule-associated protein